VRYPPLPSSWPTLFAIFAGFAAASPAAEKIDYSRDVLPILSANCFKCHGRDISTRKGKLRLDLRDAALALRNDGLAPIAPGKPDDSEILLRVASTDDDERMPPADKGRALNSSEIETLRAWIQQGAEYTEHWAFLPPAKASLPAIQDAAWAASPVDRFIKARLEAEKLTPAPRASAETLIRRASLDLTGLPPTPAEIDAFVRDTSPDAFAKLVDRLLASPHYGERYGRHWLDVARYADSGGFETDLFFGHAWRYRDYVIRAFNADKPFDRFVKEQVAGDELFPDDADARLATGFYTTGPVLQEAGMVAGKLEYDQVTDAADTTGAAFVGLTFGCARCHDHKYDPISQKEYYGLQAIFAASDQFDYSVDGKKLRDRAALRSTLKEFEAEQARARALRENDPARRAALLRKTGDAYIEADNQLKAAVDNSRRYDAIQRAVDRFHRNAKSDQSDPLAEEEGDDNNVIALKAELRGVLHGTSTPADAALANIGAVALLNPIVAPRGQGAARRAGPAAARKEAGVAPAPAVADVSPAPVANDGGTPRPAADAKVGAIAIQQPSAKVQPGGGFGLRRAFAALTGDDEKRAFLIDLGRQQIDRPKPEGYVENLDALRFELGQKHLNDVSSLPIRVLDHRDKPLETHILNRGELEQPGTVAEPCVPEKFAAGFSFADVPPERRRATLAEWIASDKNLFTARVIANRVWQWHFGEGLVRTPNDFGIRGERPTHPELLDWLAVDLVEHGWSLKHLHRVIMNSAAYQMAPTADAGTLERDPDNRLLTRFQPHRLEAELIWDNIRSVAGTLDLTMYGLPIAPPLDEQEQLGNYRKWPASAPEEANRRGLYILVKRSFRFPMLSAFDLPDNISSCGRRDITTIPNQALTLMNNRTMREQATAFATRLLRESNGQVAAVPALAWRYAYGRNITDGESADVMSFLKARADAKSAVTELCLAIFNTNEFIYLQ
jgi:hypothetical protein